MKASASACKSTPRARKAPESSASIKPLLSTTSLALAAIFIQPLGAQTHRTPPPPTDWQIEAQVQKAIANDHAFVGSSIASTVNEGVVTLTGNVRSEAEKSLAAVDLVKITGVKVVSNNLNIVDNTFHAPPAPVAAACPTGTKTVTLAQGTPLSVRLTDDVNTKTAKPGDTFRATTVTNVTLAGTAYTAIPSGTPVTGRIIDAKPAGRLSGAAELSVELVSVRLAPQPDRKMSQSSPNRFPAKAMAGARTLSRRLAAELRLEL